MKKLGSDLVTNLRFGEFCGSSLFLGGSSKGPYLMGILSEVDCVRSKERPEMERWFQRAMLTAPNNYEACSDKLHYLKPMWFGSPEDMLAFGHECISNTNWSGTVPLLMVDVHDFFAAFQKTDEDRKSYWLRPEVWPDIRAASRYHNTNTPCLFLTQV